MDFIGKLHTYQKLLMIYKTITDKQRLVFVGEIIDFMCVYLFHLFISFEISKKEKKMLHDSF